MCCCVLLRCMRRQCVVHEHFPGHEPPACGGLRTTRWSGCRQALTGKGMGKQHTRPCTPCTTVAWLMRDGLWAPGAGCSHACKCMHTFPCPQVQAQIAHGRAQRQRHHQSTSTCTWWGCLPYVVVFSHPCPGTAPASNATSNRLAVLLPGSATCSAATYRTLTSIPAWPFLQLVAKAVAAGDDIVTADAARIGQYQAGDPVAPSAAELAGRLFTTVYMGTENSSADTRNR